MCVRIGKKTRLKARFILPKNCWQTTGWFVGIVPAISAAPVK
jgi:hypothetical protein